MKSLKQLSIEHIPSSLQVDIKKKVIENFGNEIEIPLTIILDEMIYEITTPGCIMSDFVQKYSGKWPREYLVLCVKIAKNITEKSKIVRDLTRRRYNMYHS